MIKKNYVISLMLAIAMANICAASQQEADQSVLSAHADFDQVDELLKDGQECGMIDEREPVAIKPISNSEYWLRVIGGAIVLKYIAAKNCAISLWQRLCSSKKS